MEKLRIAVGVSGIAAVSAFLTMVQLLAAAGPLPIA